MIILLFVAVGRLATNKNKNNILKMILVKVYIYGTWFLKEVITKNVILFRHLKMS